MEQKQPVRKIKAEPASTSAQPRRGRGRPRKYPLPDDTKLPNKKTSTDAPKIVTRKQSQTGTTGLSRASKLLSSISQNASETDSDTGNSFYPT